MNTSFAISDHTDTSLHKKQRMIAIHFFSHDSLVNNVDLKQRILVHACSCIGYKNPDLDFPKKCTLHVHVMCWSIRLLLSVPRARCVPCLRVHFFKKIQDWILNSERIWKRILRFFAKQINPRSLRSLPVFKPWRTSYESLNYGSTDPHSQKEHTEIHKIPKFGVNRASFDWDRGI